MSTSANLLAHALANYLQVTGKCVIGPRVVLSGILDVRIKEHHVPNRIRVPVCIVIPQKWVERIPTLYVRTQDNWLKTGAQWHIYTHTDRQLCLEWDERWKEHLTTIDQETSAELPDIAAQWITRAASHILGVHYVCHLTNTKRWPKSMPSWPHNRDAARAAYEEEKETFKQTQRNDRTKRNAHH